MVSFIDLVAAAHPECRDPLRAIVGDYLGGTAAYWQTAYGRVVEELKQLHLDPLRYRSWVWPDDWFAYSNDSYYTYFGHHRNSWRQFDAVIAQLQERTQIIVNKYCHDLDTAQGIRQWRQLMRPFVIDLQCFSCGSMYPERITIFSQDTAVPERECHPCIEVTATCHDQMFADYLDTLSPRSRWIEKGTEQGRRYRLRKRHRIPDLCESRRRRRISQSSVGHS
jgi:hypothetical protein